MTPYPIRTVAELRVLVQNTYKSIDWGELVEKNSAQLLAAYRIRRVESGFLESFAKGRMNGTVHTCVGQEFSATAVAGQLAPSDWVTSNHRCHGHFIAKTGDWKALIDELHGKSTGVCKGIGSSQHLYREGFISNGPQGALLPVGTGVALKLKGFGGVVASFIGEGTLGEGITYEAINLAALLHAPQIFICENNFYSQSTPQARNTAGSIVDRFRAFGIPTYCANTWDLLELTDIAQRAIADARARLGPVALVISTYRLNAHSKGDDDRAPEEIEFFRSHDVLATIRANSNSLATAFETIEAEVTQYFDVSAQKPELTLAEYIGDQLPRKISGRYTEAHPFADRQIEAINRFLRDRVSKGALIVGEDIADPYGGAFKATAGISKLYPDQVISTPISEAGLVGLSAGYCLAGGRAIAEIMFGDFFTYAFDQVVNGISKYHHMYGRSASCPVMIRTPMGGKRGYGPTHSQSLEKFLVGIDNILAIALNSIVDPATILQECWDLGAPCIVIESKIDYGRKCATLHPELSVVRNAVPLGHLVVEPRRNKCHFTIITYGENARAIVDEYAQIVKATNAIFDLVCLVQLHPLNVGVLRRRLDRHERVLIVEDGSAPFGIGAEIAAQVAEGGFMGRIVRLGAREVPIPSPRHLELQCLIDVRRVIDAAKELLDG
jgi:2-oxoisovalerate dehydrogenase E1 component